MNRELYEKIKRLAEQSPYEGERAAARDAMKRLEAAEPSLSETTSDDYDWLAELAYNSLKEILKTFMHF
jgi:vacuolar-type H+-ATPase subunit C/Vma6